MAGHRCASVPVLNGWRGISVWRSPASGRGDEGITTLQPRIKNGSKVEVLIGDELVITGWVEATPVRYDAPFGQHRYCRT